MLCMHSIVQVKSQPGKDGTGWYSDLHHFRDIPDANLAPLGGSSQELWAAAKTIASNLV